MTNAKATKKASAGGFVCALTFALVFVTFFMFSYGAVAQENVNIAVLKPTATAGSVNRYAVVIGNGAYRNVPPLRNPKNDAEAVSAKLQQLGYTVVYAHDVDRHGMNEAVDKFLTMVQPGSEALVYYSGHGVDLNGSNYLLPIDVPVLDPDQERRLREEGINVNDLLLDLQAKSARVNIVILDACRDNPFREAKSTGLTRSLGSTRGLAAIEPPRGTFIMFAAGVGEQALDNLGSNDPNPHGVFTRNFLALLDQDGLEIHPLILRLRAQVQEAALTVGGHSQIPGYYDQLLGEFYFRPQTPTPEHAGPSDCETLINERDGKDAILAKDVDAGLKACAQAVMERPAEPRFIHLMQVSQEQAALRRALQSQDRALSEAYLVLFPTGRFVNEAKEHLASLSPTPVLTPVIPAPQPLVPIPLSPVQPKIDATEVARVLQGELNRVGCNPGSFDGVWGSSSERALSFFNQYQHKNFDIKIASLDAVTAVRGATGRVCPLMCKRGEQALNDRCVSLGCPRGQHLSNVGLCFSDYSLTQKREDIRETNKPARHLAPRTKEADDTPDATKPVRRVTSIARKTHAAGAGCYTFNDQRFCD